MRMLKLPIPDPAPWFRQTGSAATLPVLRKGVQFLNAFFYTTNLIHIQWNLFPTTPQKLKYPCHYQYILDGLCLYN